MRLHRGGFRDIPHRLCIVEICREDAFWEFQRQTGWRLVGRPLKIFCNEGALYPDPLHPRGPMGLWRGWCLVEGVPHCFVAVKVKLVPWRKERRG